MPPKASLETRKKIYQSLCYVLSDRANQVAWDEFAPADWELFAQMADREGVAPLMYWKLKDLPVAVPPSNFNFLRSTYYQTLAQNTLMYQELERILKALDEAGIPVIVLKGAALAATVYEDIGLRPMGDLDLLVREEHIQLALSALQSINYVPEPLPHLELDQKIGHDVHLRNESRDNLKVELHWQLVANEDEWFGPSMKWFWEQTRRLPLCNEGEKANLDNALTVSFTASLLYSAAHIMLQHGLGQAWLLWFFDIYLLVDGNNQDLDWGDLVEQAHEYRWTYALRAAVDQMQRLFGTSSSNEMITSLSREGNLSPDIDRLFQLRAFRTRTKATDVWDGFRLLGLKGRLKYALGMVFPNPYFMRWRYNPRPVWLWPLYYPYRWMRMVREAFLTLSRLLLPNRG